MITWPNDLPYPLVQGYNHQPGSPFYRTQFQLGTRYRKRYCPTDLLDVQFYFSKEEMARFKQLFYDDLDNGTDPFLADWEVNGDTSEKQFHFIEAYKATKKSTYYQVSAKLEVQKYTGAPL